MGVRMTAITNLVHPKAGKPTTQHLYRDKDGNPVLVINRYDRKDKKFFLPYDLASEEWKAPDRSPLYRLDELVAANDNRPVIVTEGEKCADALAGAGYVATTTSGGSNAAHKTDLSALQGRNVIIWPDKDEAGAKYAETVAYILRRDFRTEARIIPISNKLLGKVRGEDAANGSIRYLKGWDAADAVTEGWTVSNINKLLSVAAPLPNREAKESAGLFGEAEYWRSPKGTPYASIKRGSHWETFALESKAFSNLLAYVEYTETGKNPTRAKLDDMTRQMIGQALFEGDVHKDNVRIAACPGGIALDLGGPDWSQVHITAEGWQHRQAKEPRFRRGTALAGLPVPVAGSGDINALREFVNIGGDQDFRLLVGWLLGCFQTDGPYPLLILSGEQGSAKSTTTKVLRSLVDPSALSNRSFPQDERDLVIAANGAHVLAFDNLSRIKPGMADALCRLATGGGFATRKLHSDADEVHFDAARPCILNGIPDLAERADLADRSICLTLPSISETRRRYERDFWARFEEAKPRILAGLLDAVSCALRRGDSVSLSRSPRLADFARWVTSAEPALGWPEGAFLDSYWANRRETEETALCNNNLALAILALLDSNAEWRGTAADLVKTLRTCVPHLTETGEAFPRTPSVLGGELRRIKPLLEGQGISVNTQRQGKHRTRIIVLNKA